MPATDPGDVVSLMLDGLGISESSSRASIIWAGSEYRCTAGPEFDTERLDEGGFKITRNVNVTVRVSVFPDGGGLPQKGHSIQYVRTTDADPKSYRIKSITNYYGAILELHCEDSNASA